MRVLVCDGGGRLEALVHAHLSSVGQSSELLSDAKEISVALDAYCLGSQVEDQLSVVVSANDDTSLSCLIQKLSWPTCVRRPRVVLLSSLMTWGGKLYAEPILDPLSQFVARLPASSSVSAFMQENALYNITTMLPSMSIEVVVLSLGLVYGGGGWDFEGIFRGLWDFSGPESPPIKVASTKNGLNRIPAIHFSDLLTMVADLVRASSLPSFSFVPMTDGTCTTLGELLSDIGRKVNGVEPTISYYTESEMLDAIVNGPEGMNPDDMLRWNLNLPFSTMMGKQSLPVSAEQQSLSSGAFDKIWAEYLEVHALRPLSVVIAGNPKSGKTELSGVLAGKLGTVHLTPIMAVSHALKFDFAETDVAASLLRTELVAVVEAKASEGKKAPPKKGEVEAPVIVDPKTVEVTEALCASLSVDVIRRCLATSVRTNSVCVRKGYVVDAWECGAVKTSQDLSDIVAGGATHVEESESSGEQKIEDGEAEAPPPKLNQPELLVELQCADAIVLQRYMSTLGIPEGGLAKSSKENQAAVKALETTLATYASSVKAVESKVDENGENISQQFATSHELAQEVERLGGQVIRFDASATANEDLSQTVCGRLVALRNGRIGWLPEFSAPPIDTEQSPPAESEQQPAGLSADNAASELMATETGTAEAEAEAPAAFKRLHDRSIDDLNSAIKELNPESRRALMSQCDELQEYLAQNVMPHIVKGMLMVTRENPADPLEFMADFLISQGQALEDAARERALNNFNTVLAAAQEEEARL